MNPYFWTAHTAGRARGYFSDGRIRDVEHYEGETRHYYYGEGEYMLHSVENIGDSDLLFTTVEFLDGTNEPLPIPDEMRLKAPRRPDGKARRGRTRPTRWRRPGATRTGPSTGRKTMKTRTRAACRGGSRRRRRRTGASADDITLRIGSGHPPGVVYAGLMIDFFQPELKKRVEERTDHTLNFVEGYSGSIVKVTEVLEAVQDGILDIGGFCFCFEPSNLPLHAFQVMLPFGTMNPEQCRSTSRRRLRRGAVHERRVRGQVQPDPARPDRRRRLQPRHHASSGTTSPTSRTRRSRAPA